jgi:hypothetical protein
MKKMTPLEEALSLQAIAQGGEHPIGPKMTYRIHDKKAAEAAGKYLIEKYLGKPSAKARKIGE